MQIPPGDAFSQIVSGSVALPKPTPRQVPAPHFEPQHQAETAPAAGRAASAPNSPPPVERAHSIERVAQCTVPRDVPCGSLIDIQV